MLCLFTQTLCDPIDYSPPSSSVHGILQARILEWVAISSSRGIFPTQGSNPGLLHCRQILYHLSHQETPNMQYSIINNSYHNILHPMTYLFYIGVSPINSVVIDSGGQQRDSAIHIHVSILP